MTKTKDQWTAVAGLEGWQQRKVSAGHGAEVSLYQSPDGGTIKGLRAVLRWMVETQQPEQQLQQARAGLLAEGWAADPALPPHWLYRPVARGGKNYLGPDGALYNSRNVAVKHLESIGNQQQAEMISRFSELNDSRRSL